MVAISKEAALKELRLVPGVGKSIAEDLWQIGMRSLPDLKGQDPEELYARSCALQGQQIDRCLLYVYRCAVYFASAGAGPQRDAVKWWDFSDQNLQ